jgi:hypothetical protein
MDSKLYLNIKAIKRTERNSRRGFAEIGTKTEEEERVLRLLHSEELLDFIMIKHRMDGTSGTPSTE